MTWLLAAWNVVPEPVRRGLAWLGAGLVAAGVILLAVLRRDARLRQDGRDEAARDALGRDLENRRTRDAVEYDVAREPDVDGRLRRDWQRD